MSNRRRLEHLKNLERNIKAMEQMAKNSYDDGHPTNSRLTEQIKLGKIEWFTGLFDNAIQEYGFSTIDSFLLFQEDYGLLDSVLQGLRSSEKYEEVWVELLETMLVSIPVHWQLWQKGGLTSEFDEQDKKKYSHVVIQSEPYDEQLQCVCLNWSERGLKTGWPSMKKELAYDYHNIIPHLREGDHLIRYLNEPYAKKYGLGMEASIPVILRDGELTDPRELGYFLLR